MKNKLTITKEQIKRIILEDPIFDPADNVMKVLSDGFTMDNSKDIFINLLNNYDDEDIIKGIFQFGLLIGIDIGIGIGVSEEEEDDFETDICDCGCTAVH